MSHQTQPAQSGGSSSQYELVTVNQTKPGATVKSADLSDDEHRSLNPSTQAQHHLHLNEDTLRLGKGTIYWTIFSHTFVAFILVGAIALGAVGQTYNLNENKLGAIDLTTDTQLFLFGLFNKAADYVINDSLAHISGVLITVWMSQQTRFPGALPMDFELTEELSKPWLSITQAWIRWKRDPPKNKLISTLRVLFSFATGISVLLLGSAMNTIGIPKLRWYPGPSVDGSLSQGLVINVPTMRIDNVGWSNLDAAASSMLPNGNTASLRTTISDTLAATSVVEALSNLGPALNEYLVTLFAGRPTSDPLSFRNIHTIERGRPSYFSVIFENPPTAVRGRGLTNANISTNQVSTISIQEGLLFDLWTSGVSHKYGPRASGARNWLNVTLPMLSTQCTNSTTSGGQALNVTIPDKAASTFNINILSGNNGSSGMSCVVNINQVIFPVYLYNSTPDSRDEINTPLVNPAITYLNFTSQNTLIGTMAQHLLTIAVWNETTLTDQMHGVGPIQWQLYGSGPRLVWQWVIAAVLAICIIILGYNVYLLVFRKISPGPWLTVPGMMVAANSAKPLYRESMDERKWNAGEVTDGVERTKYLFHEGVGRWKCDVDGFEIKEYL